MILQTAYVNKMTTGEDTSWNVFSSPNNEKLFVLGKNFKDDQIARILRFGQHFELLAYTHGREQGRAEGQANVEAYKKEIEFLSERNRTLSIKLQQLLDKEI